MPVYEYRCKDCGEHLEVQQSFTDDALTTCEACGGPLRKVFGNVGISFKGSGFYKNDHGARAKAATSSDSTSAAASTSSDSASTPAASTPAPAAGSSSAGSGSSTPAAASGS